MSNTLELEVVDVRLSTADDKSLPAYDYTTLSAINTCPTWGLLRYLRGKSLPDGQRPTALELGHACHQAFAAIRLYQLGVMQEMWSHAEYHGRQIYGDNWEAIAEPMRDKANSDRQRVRSAMMLAFHSTGYIDDPYDKRRTIDNAEASLYTYLDQWQFDNPVWIQKADDPTAPVGVELLVDFVIELRVPSSYLLGHRPPPECIHGDRIKVRYIGRMDGLHLHSGRPVVHENKTSGRLDDSWKESYSTSHQITGYCVAASIYTDQHVSEAYAIGLQIPLPRDAFQAVAWVPVFREKHNFERWARWVVHTLELVWAHADNPTHAPMYTHSCNRYFRPCSFIPFCHGSEEDQAGFMEQLVDDRWTPLREYELKSGE